VFAQARRDLAAKEATLVDRQERRRGRLLASVDRVKKQVKRAGDARMDGGQVRNLKKKLGHLGVGKTDDGKRWKWSLMGERRVATIEAPDPPIHFRMESAGGLSHGLAIMQLEGVSFSYNATHVSSCSDPSPPPSWVLADTTAAVRAGDRIAIVGANGQGKSTLVRLLLGELVP